MSYEHNPSKAFIRTAAPRFRRANYGMARDENGKVLERLGEETIKEFEQRMKPSKRVDFIDQPAEMAV